MKALTDCAFFSYGFRPFFFAGAIWASVSILLWTAALNGFISLPTSYGPVYWHAHELIFGYASAVMTGFILTAIPSWTGRDPIRGRKLAFLFAMWLCGRVAIWFSTSIGAVAAATIDSIFLLSVAALVFREIISSDNRRNLKVAFIFLLFAVANMGFHIELIVRGFPIYSIRFAISLLVVLIMIIGGRIIPNFTHNWLVKHNRNIVPAPFGKFDIFAIVFSIFVLLCWNVFPSSVFTGLLLITAAAVHCIRLSRWSGIHTVNEPLVVILHIGYFFIPLGFATVGFSVLWPALVPAGTALHAWMTGAVGVMTLGVMTRAARGHTGRALTASRATVIVYLLVVIATFVRLATMFVPSFATVLLDLAALAWFGAFTIFAISYAPMFLLPSRDASLP